MRGKFLALAGVTAVALIATAALPAVGLSVFESTAVAAPTKVLQANGGGGGGGNVGGAGTRLGDLLSGWAVPVLIVIAGCLLIGTLASRNIGASVGIVLITLIGLIFLLSPQSIESLAKNVANVVF